MKLSELKKITDHYIKSYPQERDFEVVIQVERAGAAGGTPCVDVRAAISGFDWDSGKFMLLPVEPLIEINRKVKQKIMTPTELKKYLYRNKPTARKVGGTPSVYLYHADVDQSYVVFRVPVAEMGENPFEDEIPAQLLIRWLV